MINFEEELKKFHLSLEVEDVEDSIYNQDLTDMADIFVKLIKDMDNETTARKEAKRHMEE